MAPRKPKPGNSLAEKYSDLAKEWCYELNAGLTPKDVSFGSSKKVWWICENGHPYDAVVSHRTGKNPTGCPYCANREVWQTFNDLVSQFPDVADEWCWEENDLTPYDVVYSSHKNVKWKCKNNHPSWDSMVYTRTMMGHGCPYCSGRLAIPGETDLATFRPGLVDEWDFDNNGKQPSDVTLHSSYKAQWICKRGHKPYKMRVADRVDGGGCPSCAKTSTSFMEQFLFNSLRTIFGDNEVKHRNKKILALGKQEIDIYLPNYNFAVEIGSWFWHKDKVDKDKMKCDVCKEKGIELFTFYDSFSGEVSELFNNCFVYDFSLSTESNFSTLKNIVQKIVTHIGYEFDFSTIDWDFIISQSQQFSRKKDLQRIIAECKKVNNKVNILAFDPSDSDRVIVECSQCHYIPPHSQYISNVRKGRGAGCGCNGSVQNVTKEVNDLWTTHKELAQELVNPDDGYIVSAGSTKKLKWYCKKCGKVYSATVCRRAAGRGHYECYKAARQRIRCIETGEEWSSLSEVERSTSVPRKGLSKAVKSGSTFHGYHWERVYDN